MCPENIYAEKKNGARASFYQFAGLENLHFANSGSIISLKQINLKKLNLQPTFRCPSSWTGDEDSGLTPLRVNIICARFYIKSGFQLPEGAVPAKCALVSWVFELWFFEFLFIHIKHIPTGSHGKIQVWFSLCTNSFFIFPCTAHFCRIRHIKL